MPKKKRLIFPIVFISGFCSLLYQVVWERIIAFNFGGDSISCAIVTSTFILGLGIGAYIFRKYKNKAITTYAQVEMAVGIFGILSYYLFSNLAVSLAYLLNFSNTNADFFRLTLVLICIIFLLPPCILMGGTLPLIFNSFIKSGDYKSKKVGLLYGFNTLGASFGIFSAPFLFLNNLTIPQTLILVGMTNIILSFLIKSFASVPLIGRINYSINSNLKKKKISKNILGLASVSGLLSLAVEIIFFRMASVFLPSFPYNFPLILAPFLFFLSLGSIIFTRFKKYSLLSVLKRICFLFLFSGLAFLSSIYIINFFTYSLPRNSIRISRVLFAYTAAVLPFAFFQGGIFPLILKLAAPKTKELPPKTGIIYLINSLGAFIGVMSIQFIGFPLLGSKKIIIVIFYTSLFTAVSIGVKYLKKLKVVPIVTSLFLIPLPFFIPLEKWNSFLYGREKVPEVVEGISGIATISWNEDKTGGGVWVNGQYMSQLPDHPKHVRLAVYPLSSSRREKVLFLGLGGGGMLRELAKDQKIKKIDVVDWSYELSKILRQPAAAKILDHVLDNSKVTLYKNDARIITNLLPAQSYDLVIDNLAESYWAGATHVKSVGYFKTISRLLKPEGLFILDINAANQEVYEAIIASLVRNFNSVSTHYHSIAICQNGAFEFQPQKAFNLEDAGKVVTAREKILEISEPAKKWFLAGFEKMPEEKYLKIKPVCDDFLGNEYYYHPFQSLINKFKVKTQ